MELDSEIIRPGETSYLKENPNDESDLPPEFCHYPVERKSNPYGFIPFVTYPNLREPKKFWGISDLCQLMLSQRELNRAMSQLAKILELSGNPIAVLENVEESEDIGVRPGAVWNLPEDARFYLRHTEIAATSGAIRIPPNCGQQLYDVIDITDPLAGLSSVKKRVTGIILTYNPLRGEYEEQLLLGAL